MTGTIFPTKETPVIHPVWEWMCLNIRDMWTGSSSKKTDSASLLSASDTGATARKAIFFWTKNSTAIWKTPRRRDLTWAYIFSRRL